MSTVVLSATSTELAKRASSASATLNCDTDSGNVHCNANSNVVSLAVGLGIGIPAFLAIIGLLILYVIHLKKLKREEIRDKDLDVDGDMDMEDYGLEGPNFPGPNMSYAGSINDEKSSITRGSMRGEDPFIPRPLYILPPDESSGKSSIEDYSRSLQQTYSQYDKPVYPNTNSMYSNSAGSINNLLPYSQKNLSNPSLLRKVDSARQSFDSESTHNVVHSSSTAVTDEAKTATATPATSSTQQKPSPFDDSETTNHDDSSARYSYVEGDESELAKRNRENASFSFENEQPSKDATRNSFSFENKDVSDTSNLGRSDTKQFDRIKSFYKEYLPREETESADRSSFMNPEKQRFSVEGYHEPPSSYDRYDTIEEEAEHSIDNSADFDAHRIVQSTPPRVNQHQSPFDSDHSDVPLQANERSLTDHNYDNSYSYDDSQDQAHGQNQPSHDRLQTQEHSQQHLHEPAYVHSQPQNGDYAEHHQQLQHPAQPSHQPQPSNYSASIYDDRQQPVLDDQHYHYQAPYSPASQSHSRMGTQTPTPSVPAAPLPALNDLMSPHRIGEFDDPLGYAPKSRSKSPAVLPPLTIPDGNHKQESLMSPHALGEDSLVTDFAPQRKYHPQSPVIGAGSPMGSRVASPIPFDSNGRATPPVRAKPLIDMIQDISDEDLRPRMNLNR